jgi:hypothetical protein
MALQNFKPVIIALLLSIGGSMLMNAMATIAFSSSWYISILFHLFISFLIQLLLFRRTDDQRDYTFKIMFASMGRLLFCMIGLLIYKVFDKHNFTQFALHFMLHYILFTVFEIAYLLKFIKTPKK